jgi:hypothetical protein
MKIRDYGIGTKVFCDFHFSGKPRGKVIEIIKEGSGKDNSGSIRVQIIENHKAYKKGEIVTVSSNLCVPVEQISPLTEGQIFIRINTLYRWVR